MILDYNKLWKLMIDKKLNKTQLSEMAGITTNEMAKMGKEEIVKSQYSKSIPSTEQIKKYPNALDVVKEYGKKLSDCKEEELREILNKLEKGDKNNE